MTYRELHELLGNIDIYLLDQILKGRFGDCHKILDAGCGEGRNSRYLSTQGKDIHFIDRDPSAIKMVRMLYRMYPDQNFTVGELNQLPYEDGSFDAVICSAVLHFASDSKQFEKWTDELFRVLRTNGLLFIRMSTEAGLDHDATFPYNLKRSDLALIEERADLLEPFKTVVVEERSMAVLVLGKK